MSQPIEVHTLSGAYALNALTELERAGFARHLAECPACATEVAEFRETAARLGLTASEPPPPRLRERVLAEVAQTRQVIAGSRPARADRSPDVARWRRRTAAAVAAGLIAVGGGTAAWVVQEQRVSRANTEASAVAGVLAAGDAQVRTVDVPGGGRVTVVVSPSQHDGVAVMADMPALPSGKAYQLWLITGSSPASAGVMDPGQTSGHALIKGLGSADTLGVTVEPAGGSVQPTTRVVAGVPLT
jgi:anti-sigma-K factor RskA